MNKRLLTLLFFVVSFSAQGQTSVYHPFPDSNAVWNFQYWLWFGCPQSLMDRFENYSYVLNGDTTIGSQQYHKLYTPFVELNCASETPHHDTGYVGCIRQDTVARKVYFVYPNDSVDSLLYDFSLQVGDTVRGMLSPIFAQPDTVIAIDSILVGSDYRKRWYINSAYSVYLIEGVGSDYGLIESSPGYITDAAVYTLICFKQNGITLYPDTLTSCNIIDGVISVTNENTFSLFPNPTTNEFKVQSSKLRRWRFMMWWEGNKLLYP